MDRRSLLDAGIIGLALACSTAACASDFASCFEEAHADYREAQRRWHGAMHEAVLARDAALARLSDINTELQLAMIARAEKRIDFLASRRPAELRLDGDLAELLNPDWSSADDSAMAARDPEYDRLAKRIAALRSQGDGHPDWPALRALVRDEVGTSPSATRARTELELAGNRFLREVRACRQLTDVGTAAARSERGLTPSASTLNPIVRASRRRP